MKIVKYSILGVKDKVIYSALVIASLFFLGNYALWWFQPNHIPDNWNNNLHIFDIVLFLFLSFVVFIGSVVRIGSWFALMFAARPIPISPQKGLRVAFVTCFVPGKEPIEMLEKTLWAMKNVRYPHDTWVLDEGNDREVKSLCNRLNVCYFTRYGIAKYNQKNGIFRTKTKAGNHNAWRDLFEEKYDIVGQIDVDHVPDPAFFEKTLGYFKDEKVGFVGMPQSYGNTENWIARGSSEQSYFFHGPMQQGFYGADMPFFIGTSHVYRTKAMNQIGGYFPTIVEDHITGMQFYAHGWKGVFVPEILAIGEGPMTWVSYFNQQMRWSYGLFEILFKHTPRLIFRISWKKKINYFLAQMYYFTGVAVFIGCIMTILYLAFGIRSASMNIYEWLQFAIPPFVLANAIQVYIHKFHIDPKKEPIFGILGMFLNLASNIIYSIAFFKFVTGQRLRYLVTTKGSTALGQRDSLSVFALHIALVVVLTLSLIVSFYNSNTAIQLRFWALFNIVTLGGAAISIYREDVRKIVNTFSFAFRMLRFGLRVGFAFAVIVFLLITYTNRNEIVIAIQNSSVPQQIQIQEEKLGGKIDPQPNSTFVGVSVYQHNDSNYIESLEKTIGNQFTIIGYYQAWGAEDNLFDKDWAGYISKHNAIPLVTWEPWKPIAGFDRSEEIVYQEEYLLKHITEGKYDDYIIKYALDIKQFKKPIMIRLAHEMNGNWYPWGSSFNTPDEYIEAWRHIHNLFEEIGAANVTWVWSPNEIYYEDRIPFAHQIEKFYPGDEYVDWVGFSAFNWGNTYKQTGWRMPDELYGQTVETLKQFHKPIFITETASTEKIGSQLGKAQWITELANYVEQNTEIKGIVWFQASDNGVDWRIDSTNESARAFKTDFSSYFIQEAGDK